MAEIYKGRKGQHCLYYAALQRSVKDSFLCTGGGCWDPCPDYDTCRLLEVRNGTPKPWDPDKPKRKRRGRKTKG